MPYNETKNILYMITDSSTIGIINSIFYLSYVSNILKIT